VQEVIDICEFAVGLSRQLHGLTIASERPGHRMMETWHPLGPSVVITAFNFLSPCGPGTPRSLSCAATPCCGNPRRKRQSPH
jgi:aldehyde dehydrogenase (NAD+)